MAAKLGIIAGRGDLPRRLVAACQEAGRPFFVLAFHGQTDPETVAGVDHAWVRLGAAGEGMARLHDAGAVELVMAGGIRRLNLRDMNPDRRTRRFLTAIGFSALGDDGLLRGVVRELEKEGFTVIGIDDVIDRLLAPGGVLGAVQPARDGQEDIALAVRAARALGAGDTGQGALARDGRVIGVESATGTDDLLAAQGLAGSVLAKMRKPGQERRVDLPTIGPETIDQAAAAGLAGIAVQAGGALILDRAETIRRADARGLFVVGVARPSVAEDPGPVVYLVAGEPSGDLLGGRLMRALRRQTGGRAVFIGVGGATMTEQGLRSLFPMGELSVMGLIEVIPHLPRIFRRLRQTVADVRRCRPDVLVTIDSPGFSFRMAKKLTGLGFPLIHYVAPTVWAWKPHRAAKVARFLDHILALFPFEPPYFEAEGLACTFVGHSVVEDGAAGDGAGFRIIHDLAPGEPVLCLLPGSRLAEVNRLLPVYRETVTRLARRFPTLRCVLPTMPTVADAVRRALADWPVPVVVCDGRADKAAAFAAVDVALAASGTVTLELAQAGTPTVIAYRVAPLTAWIGRRLIKVRWAGLVNILMNRPVMPEFLQENCTPENLEAEISRLLQSPVARRKQNDAMAEALVKIGDDGPPPSSRAAAAVLAVIAKNKTARE